MASEDLLSTFNSTMIQLKDDPRIANLPDTFRCITYTFKQMMSVWLRLAKARQESTDASNPYNRTNVTSGYLYNHIIVSGQYNNAAPTEYELSDIEFEHACDVFVQAARSIPKLSMVIKRIDDVYDATWELLYHFIIPIRLIASTIPKDVRVVSLRKWFNVVMPLPFITKYTQQYINVIPNVQRLGDFYKQFIAALTAVITSGGTAGDDIISKFARIPYDDIALSFISTVACRNNTQLFIRLCASIFIIASIDIIKHYCPNYIACANINPDFDGTWVNMFDPYHMDHIRKVNDLLTFTKTT